MLAGSADAQPRRLKFKPVEKSKVAQKGKKESGPAVPPGPHLLVVSINKQRVTLYSNGNPVAVSPVSTGTAQNPTPTGVFSIIQKNRHHRSNIYSNAPMPFMQRLTWSGVALHEGRLPGYPASHGCIRLPGDFAQFLWRTTKIGARVIVAREEIEPVAIAHARLFQPAKIAASDVNQELRKAIDTGPIKTAEVTSTLTDVSSTDRLAAAEPKPADIPDDILRSFAASLDAKAKKPEPKGPISIFISRKEKKLYVRQAYEPLWSEPVTIRDEGTVIGTHVFTALERHDGGEGLRWVALTMPAEKAELGRKARAQRNPEPMAYRLDRRGRPIPVIAPKPAEPSAIPAPPAASVLDRIELAPEAAARISPYINAGASLIVSDHGLGYETGLYTDFIVVTR